MEAKLGEFNRIEVIDENGRSYVWWTDVAMTVKTSVQDEGRTLKLFFSERED